MAAAVIPIAAAVLPSVIPLVVKLVDKIFPPKSGASKADAATEIVAAIQQGLANSKALAGAQLNGEQIKTAVQGVVDALNAQGVLKGAATAIEGVVAGNVPASVLLRALIGFLEAVGK